MTNIQRDASIAVMARLHGANGGRQRSGYGRWAAWAVTAVLMGVIPQFARAQEACPTNAHVTRVEQTGNVVTLHCACNAGYQDIGGQCRPPPGLDRELSPKLNPTMDPDIQHGLNRQAERIARQKEAERQAEIAACVKKYEAHMSAARWIDDNERILHICSEHVATIAGVRG